MMCQSNEIARKCVEPPKFRPLKTAVKKGYQPPFASGPHIKEVLRFILQDTGHRYPKEICVICKGQVFDEDPKEVTRNPKSPKFVTRLYCNHIFHYKCLDDYMTKPPFTVIISLHM